MVGFFFFKVLETVLILCFHFLVFVFTSKFVTMCISLEDSGRERVTSSIHWFTPQITAAAGTRPGFSQGRAALIWVLHVAGRGLSVRPGGFNWELHWKCSSQHRTCACGGCGHCGCLLDPLYCHVDPSSSTLTNSSTRVFWELIPRRETAWSASSRACWANGRSPTVKSGPEAHVVCIKV